MFELLSKHLNERDYLSASSILRLINPPTDPLPDGFSSAAVRIVPLDDCFHVFVTIDDPGAFRALPGELETTSAMGVLLTAKMMPMRHPDCEMPLVIHWLHLESEDVLDV